MTNRELLNTPKKQLSFTDHHRRRLLRVHLLSMPCASCRTPLDILTAARIDLDELELGSQSLHCLCPQCGAELKQVNSLSFLDPPWSWQIGRD
jgi:hypothetical protein